MTREERRIELNDLNVTLEHLAWIASNDEYKCKKLKSFIKKVPINRYKDSYVDLSVFNCPWSDDALITNTNTECYAALLYVQKHKQEVDKLIRKLKKQRNKLQSMQVEEENGKN